jgi:hypothetical protein
MARMQENKARLGQQYFGTSSRDDYERQAMARMRAHTVQLSQTAADGGGNGNGNGNGAGGLSELEMMKFVGEQNLRNQQAAFANVAWNQRMYGYGIELTRKLGRVHGRRWMVWVWFLASSKFYMTCIWVPGRLIEQVSSFNKHSISTSAKTAQKI